MIEPGTIFPSARQQGCSTDAVANHPFHPVPDGPDGILTIDPEVRLKAAAFDLEISFYYSTQSAVSQELGNHRSASVRGYIIDDSGESGGIYAVRGDFRVIPLTLKSSGGGISNYVAQAGNQGVTTFSYDGTTWKEYFADGYQIQYQAQKTGTVPLKSPISRIVHPSGACHTYTYGAGAEQGLIKAIEEPAGRLLTFTYAKGVTTSLLSTLEDWGARLWTFQYDGSGNLTSFQTPLGCETAYSYAAVGSMTLISGIT